MKRINKTEARRRFNAGEAITLIPCKCTFNSFWCCMYYEAQKGVTEHPYSSFDSVVNAFVYYNCNYETGYYPHYYINESEELKK